MCLAQEFWLEVIAQGYGAELQCVVLLNETRSGACGDISVPDVLHGGDVPRLLPAFKKDSAVNVFLREIHVLHIINERAVVSVAAKMVEE